MSWGDHVHPLGRQRQAGSEGLQVDGGAETGERAHLERRGGGQAERLSQMALSSITSPARRGASRSASRVTDGWPGSLASRTGRLSPYPDSSRRNRNSRGR